MWWSVFHNVFLCAGTTCSLSCTVSQNGLQLSQCPCVLYCLMCCLSSLPAVKPDPPEKVVATPIPNNVRRLEVTWNSPSTWPDVESFPLKYFLRYRPLIRDQWQHVSYRYKCNTHTHSTHTQKWLVNDTRPAQLIPTVVTMSCHNAASNVHDPRALANTM